MRFEYPADAVLSRYFREHPALGQKDRGFVAESVFGVLRHKRVLESVSGKAGARDLLVSWLARFDVIQLGELAAVLKPCDSDWLAHVKEAPAENLPAAVRAELPDWVYERLNARMSEPEILELGRALQQPAPLDLRVNTYRSDRRTVLDALRAS